MKKLLHSLNRHRGPIVIGLRIAAALLEELPAGRLQKLARGLMLLPPPPKKKTQMNDLETNQTNAALLRDTEREIAQRAEPPVDLRSVPREQWDRFLDWDVTLPAIVKVFLERKERLSESFTRAEVHAIEEATELHHAIEEPYHVTMSPTLQTTGRAWAYVWETEPYLTGLVLGKK